jgi:hypothetical protein
MITALLLSFKAPARISLALAVPLFTWKQIVVLVISAIDNIIHPRLSLQKAVLDFAYSTVSPRALNDSKKRRGI